LERKNKVITKKFTENRAKKNTATRHGKRRSSKLK